MCMINPEWWSVIVFSPSDDIPINLSCHQPYNASRNLMTMFLTVWCSNMGTVTCGDLWNHCCSRRIGVDQKKFVHGACCYRQRARLPKQIRCRWCRKCSAEERWPWLECTEWQSGHWFPPTWLSWSLACWMAAIICRNDMPIETWSIANSKCVVFDCDLVCWLIGLFDE